MFKSKDLILTIEPDYELNVDSNIVTPEEV